MPDHLHISTGNQRGAASHDLSANRYDLPAVPDAPIELVAVAAGRSRTTIQLFMKSTGVPTRKHGRHRLLDVEPIASIAELGKASVYEAREALWAPRPAHAFGVLAERIGDLTDAVARDLAALSGDIIDAGEHIRTLILEPTPDSDLIENLAGAAMIIPGLPAVTALSDIKDAIDDLRDAHTGLDPAFHGGPNFDEVGNGSLLPGLADELSIPILRALLMTRRLLDHAPDAFNLQAIARSGLLALDHAEASLTADSNAGPTSDHEGEPTQTDTTQQSTTHFDAAIAEALTDIVALRAALHRLHIGAASPNHAWEFLRELRSKCAQIPRPPK